MSYKYYGKLAGSTPAVRSLWDTSPSNTTTPFKTNAPSTKFMAYGEAATSTAFNRAFGAVSANMDSMKSVLDAPALRTEILSPTRTSTDASPSKAGFFALTEHNSGTNAFGVTTNQAEIDLAGLAVPNTVPPAWVYVGLHQREVSRFVRLYGSEQDQTLYQTRGDASLKTVIRPSNIKARTGSASAFFPTTDYHGDDEHALPYSIPPISEIEVDLAPYSGNALTIPLHTWETDGVTIRASSHSFSDLLLRPGCYVKIENDGDPDTIGTPERPSNNGLYQIASIRQSNNVGAGGQGDKAVLTRGNLAKVTVGDYTTYTAGDLVSWKPHPDHNDQASTPEERVLYAHVVHIIPRPDLVEYVPGEVQGDLYLASIGGSEDFTGKKVASTGFQSGGRRAYADIGLPDHETDSLSNWTMPKRGVAANSGTRLYRYNGAAWVHEEVTDVVAPGEPVTFVLDKNPGQLKPCNPLGFLLNPTLVFAEGDRPIKQDYYVYCNTLTTVGEQLRSQGASATRGAYEDSSAPMDFCQGDYRALSDFARHVRMGYNQWAPLNDENAQFGDGFSPTANTLGNDICYLEMEQTVGAVATFEAACIAEPIVVGDKISFEHPNKTTSRLGGGRVVRISSDYIIIKNMSWDPPQAGTNRHEKHITTGENQVVIDEAQPFAGFSTIVLGARTYKVKKMWSGPVALDSSDAPFTPTWGLNAAYHSDYSADPEKRGQIGSGNWVAYSSNTRPITVLLSDTINTDQTFLRVATDLPETHSIYLTEAIQRNSATDTALVGGHTLTPDLPFDGVRTEFDFTGLPGTGSLFSAVKIGGGANQLQIVLSGLIGEVWADTTHLEDPANPGYHLLPPTLGNLPSSEASVNFDTGHIKLDLGGYNPAFLNNSVAVNPYHRLYSEWLGSVALENHLSHQEERYGAGATFNFRCLTFMDRLSHKWVATNTHLGLTIEDAAKGIPIPLTSVDTHAIATAVAKPGAGAGVGVNTVYAAGSTWAGTGMPARINTYTDEKQPSITEGIEAALTGIYVDPAGDTGTQKSSRTNNFGSFSNGLLKGAYQSFQGDVTNNSTDDQWGNACSYTGADIKCFDIGESWYLKGGAKIYHPETRIDMNSAQSTGGPFSTGQFYCFYRFAFGTDFKGGYDILPVGGLEAPGAPAGNYTWDDPYSVPICIVDYHSTTGVQKIIDCRRRVSRQDMKTHIYVGQTGGAWEFPAIKDSGTYPGDEVHFSTLGAAFKAIECWEQMSTEVDTLQAGERKWTIEVASFTFEIEDPDRGITWPYRVPSNGLIVTGRKCNSNISSNVTPLIRWGYTPNPSGSPGTEQNLIDFNNKSGLVFRDLSFTWMDANQTDMNLSAVNQDLVYATLNYAQLSGINLFVNRANNPGNALAGTRPGAGSVNSYIDYQTTGYPNNAVGSQDILIENVHLKGGSGFFCHHDYWNMDNLTIRDCTAYQISTTFVTLSAIVGDPLNGAGTTFPGYHANVVIENCHATAAKTTAAFGVEKHSPHGIFLDMVCGYVVRNCVIEGFVNGIMVPDHDVYHGSGFGSTDGVQDSWGTIEGNTLIKSGQNGIHCYSTSRSTAELPLGTTRILNNHIESNGWSRSDLGGSWLNTDPWYQNDNYGAIVAMGHDFEISGNVIARRKVPGTPLVEDNDASHRLIYCGGNQVSFNAGGDVLARNVRVTNNRNMSWRGHGFLDIGRVKGAIVSGNIEELDVRQHSDDPVGVTTKTHVYQSSFKGVGFQDFILSDNVFAGNITLAPAGDAANLNITVENNIFGGYAEYPAATAANSSIIGRNVLVRGNTFNGLTVDFAGPDTDCTHTRIIDNDFSRNLDTTFSATSYGGDIRLSAGGTCKIDNSIISGNTSAGGSIIVQAIVDTAALPGSGTQTLRAPEYWGVDINGNNLVFDRHQMNTFNIKEMQEGQDATNIGFRTDYGANSGGSILMQSFPRHCFIRDNNVGRTDFTTADDVGDINVCYVRDKAYTVNTPVTTPTANIFGEGDDTDHNYQFGPYGNIISGNNLNGGRINVVGNSTQITGNTVVGEIFLNWDRYEPDATTPLGTGKPLNEAYGDNAIISGNMFLGRIKCFDNTQWKPSIFIGGSSGSRVDGNKGVKLIKASSCPGIQITNNSSYHSGSFHNALVPSMENTNRWDGGFGISFGDGGCIVIAGDTTYATISGNDLLWPFRPTGDKSITFVPENLPGGGTPNAGYVTEGWHVGYWDTTVALPGFSGGAIWREYTGNIVFEAQSRQTWTTAGDGAYVADSPLAAIADGIVISNNRLNRVIYDGDPLLPALPTERGLFEIENGNISGNWSMANMWWQDNYDHWSKSTDTLRPNKRNRWFEVFNKGSVFVGNTAWAGVHIGPRTSDFPSHEGSGGHAFSVYVGNKQGGVHADTTLSGGSVAMAGNNCTDFSAGAFPGVDTTGGNSDLKDGRSSVRMRTVFNTTPSSTGFCDNLTITNVDQVSVGAVTTAGDIMHYLYHVELPAIGASGDFSSYENAMRLGTSCGVVHTASDGVAAPSVGESGYNEHGVHFREDYQILGSTTRWFYTEQTANGFGDE